MMSHLHFLKNGTLPWQRALVLCGAMFCLRDNPVKLQADSVNISLLSLSPWSPACWTEFEWSFLP